MNGVEIGYLMARHPEVVQQMAKEAGSFEDNLAGVGEAAAGPGVMRRGLNAATRGAEAAGGGIGKGIAAAGRGIGRAGGAVERGAGAAGGLAQKNPKAALAVAILTSMGAGYGGYKALGGGSDDKQK